MFSERKSDGDLLASLSSGNIFHKSEPGRVCCQPGAGTLGGSPRLFQFLPSFLALFCRPVWKWRRLDPDRVKSTSTIFREGGRRGGVVLSQLSGYIDAALWNAALRDRRYIWSRPPQEREVGAGTKRSDNFLGTPLREMNCAYISVHFLYTHTPCVDVLQTVHTWLEVNSNKYIQRVCVCVRVWERLRAVIYLC